MSKLTREEAISECKELWRQIKESGLSKSEFLDTPTGKIWKDKDYQNNCPLCQYALKDGGGCSYCPLIKQRKQGCSTLGFYETHVSEPKWFEAVEGLK